MKLLKNDKPDTKGKILNPKTGRYIKDKSIVSMKPDTKGKILNPKTGRYIKDKSIVSMKTAVVCPRDNYLNPITNRCNRIITSTKLKNKIDVNTCPKLRRPVNNQCKINEILKMNKDRYKCCYKK